jgi:hypothetical protein
MNFLLFAKGRSLLVFFLLFTVLFACKKEEEEDPPPTGTVQLGGIMVGSSELELTEPNSNIPVDSVIVIEFNNILDPQSVPGSISLRHDNADLVGLTTAMENENKTIRVTTDQMLIVQADYSLRIANTIRGASGETFAGLTVNFSTQNGTMTIETVTLNGIDFSQNSLRDVDWNDVEIRVRFSHPLDPNDYESHFFLAPGVEKSISLSTDRYEVTVQNTEPLEYYEKFYFYAQNTLTAANGFSFEGFTNTFVTALDSTDKFPLLSEDELFDLIQQKTFDYFYEFAHPDAGLARERNTSGDIVTIGGSGFGVMALIVGIERNFISRQQGLDHLDKVLNFLETCDRFHGAWPHWLIGSTGQTQPFSSNDDGADLVETSFMIQGLYTMRQYLNPGVQEEQLLIDRINTLIDSVEWDWFTRNQNVLYWHWSPNVGWAMNMKIQGNNETMIAYVLAAASETHTINAEAYHQGYARNGAIVNGNSYYGYTLPLGYEYGGPLFFTHYSYLGLDPRNLSDQYANYWEQNVNHSLINWAYCEDNPKNYIGYRTDSWGLTASDNHQGYSAHSPTNDLGVITPTAAISSLPYTPEQSLDAIHHFYYKLGDRLWGPYGFYDAFNVTEGWWASSYIAIDQGPIVVMIENYRTGLLWDLFMSSPEIQAGLDKLGFNY